MRHADKFHRSLVFNPASSRFRDVFLAQRKHSATTKVNHSSDDITTRLAGPEKVPNYRANLATIEHQTHNSLISANMAPCPFGHRDLSMATNICLCAAQATQLPPRKL
jgi:hypothetical protein